MGCEIDKGYYAKARNRICVTLNGLQDCNKQCTKKRNKNFAKSGENGGIQ